ncbi:hypothetical protein [Marinobacter similis]|uniref:Uncharacterized protein n=1 Tax=Marinobacter similis TaxID=1420916 RepID=W5YL78_9GAMM|nr:hypothetical protein [Marinobacter similis]AHI29957.1 hypothetical protein AU14_02340 [Marinobacter similis]
MIVWEGKSLVVTLFRTWAKTSVSDYLLAYQSMVNHHPHREWVKIIDFTDYVETSDLLGLLYADELKHIRKDIAEWSVRRGMIRQVIILAPGIPKDVIEQLIQIYDNSGAPAETVSSRHEASVRAEEVLKGHL